MTLMEECWLVLDQGGDVIAQSESHADAVQWALTMGMSPVIDDLSADMQEEEPRLVANPRAGKLLPTAELGAMAAGPISVMANEVDRIPLQEAYEQLVPYFPRIRSSGSARLVLQDNVANLVKSFLGANFKTSKKVKRGRPARIQGLLLAPYYQWLRAMRAWRNGDRRIQTSAKKVPVPDKRWLDRFLRLTEDLDLPPVVPQGEYDHCVGSSHWCRGCCLQGTGRGVAAHAVIKKMVLSTMMHHVPIPFFRVLREAIDRHAHNSMVAGKQPMVRLNVFSDIPWEVVVPWLIDEKSRGKEKVQFYDYTKLVGRGPVTGAGGNYDITFSFSGDNQHEVASEIEHGTRIAVVFVGKSRPQAGSTFFWPDPDGNGGWELPVVSGVDDDARPRDPTGCIVALKYVRPPGGPSAGAFVVKAYRHPQGFYVTESHLPRQTNIEIEEED